MAPIIKADGAVQSLSSLASRDVRHSAAAALDAARSHHTLFLRNINSTIDLVSNATSTTIGNVTSAHSESLSLTPGDALQNFWDVSKDVVWTLLKLFYYGYIVVVFLDIVFTLLRIIWVFVQYNRVRPNGAGAIREILITLQAAGGIAEQTPLGSSLAGSGSASYDAFGRSQAADATISGLESNFIRDEDLQSNDSCVICLEPFQTKTNTIMTNCRHILHRHCLREWLTTSAAFTCPVCRHDLVLSTSG